MRKKRIIKKTGLEKRWIDRRVNDDNDDKKEKRRNQGKRTDRWDDKGNDEWDERENRKLGKEKINERWGRQWWEEREK